LLHPDILGSRVGAPRVREPGRRRESPGLHLQKAARMIPVQGVENLTIAVLGLGRSGKATAAALAAGGANVVAWDDGADTCEAAQAEDMTILDLTRDEAWHGVSGLITSPGIPHLYPHPHPVIAKAYMLGVPVDNDIGLFF